MVVQRLLLFDIDGTLVQAGEIGRAVFDRAVGAVLGRAPSGRVQMSGKTDPQIVREYLAMDGAGAYGQLPVVLKQLEAELANAAGELEARGSPCQGVPELLAALSADPRLHLSVLTGNIQPNAIVKLSAFGLQHWLDLEVGAYGSDSEDRTALVPIALSRLAERRGAYLRSSDVWVIGDTPRDYECAKAVGARCLLVATGRFGVPELSRLGAEVVVENFTSTEDIVQLLTAGL
ncbi:MAG: HAD family hydrolase [Acidimicrobiales bacterium]